MEGGHENVPEQVADMNKTPEVGQPKDIPQDACQTAWPEEGLCREKGQRLSLFNLEYFSPSSSFSFIKANFNFHLLLD